MKLYVIEFNFDADQDDGGTWYANQDRCFIVEQDAVEALQRAAEAHPDTFYRIKIYTPEGE